MQFRWLFLDLKKKILLDITLLDTGGTVVMRSVYSMQKLVGFVSVCLGVCLDFLNLFLQNDCLRGGRAGDRENVRVFKIAWEKEICVLMRIDEVV